MNSNNNNGGGSNNNSEDNHKKRKVWRTVNVSAGGGPPQAMTPEAAAKYIQQATASRGREVKISFGPSRPPNNGGGGNSSSGGGGVNAASSVSFGSLDLAALKETAAAAAAAGKPKGKGGKGASGGKNKDGLPCSEAEMKALMSMFVEIMGMSMDPEKLKNANLTANAAAANMNASGNSKNAKNNKKGPVFMFGNNVPPFADSEAAAGFFTDGASWEAIRQTYAAAQAQAEAQHHDDDDSIPDLSIDDMREELKRRQKAAAAAVAASNITGPDHSKISPDDWESLERVAMDESLEAEDRARKAAKKREKKQRKKLKQKEEAAQKAAEAALKKREKAILSWRSRVVSACQSNEISKLEALLNESPLRKLPEEENVIRSSVLPHLQFLLPNSVAKNRSLLERGKEARYRLATHILMTDIPIAFNPLRSGRSALHTACFNGDVQFVSLVLDKVSNYEDVDSLLPSNYLNMTCDDSGWAPLHYAAVSGSMECLEVVLAGGCDVRTITDDTHTWRESDGSGITAREMVQCIHDGSYEKVLESHGVALQEMANAFFCSHAERRTFLKTLDRVIKRLTDVEINGYSPPSNTDKASAIAGNDDASNIEVNNEESKPESAAARKRKKKKKKKQAQKEAEAAAAKNNAASAPPAPAASVPDKEPAKDPLVIALLGMGFTEDQISAAVRACGGTNRATADDLVTWILGNDGDGNVVTETPAEEPEEEPFHDEVEVNESTVVKTKVVDEAKWAEEAARQKEEAAKRLAAKREEKRRRNREWNNREQARQEQEAKAKMAQAMAVQVPQAHQPVAAAATPYTAPHPSGGLQTGVPTGMKPPTVTNPALNTGLPPPQQQHQQPNFAGQPRGMYAPPASNVPTGAFPPLPKSMPPPAASNPAPAALPTGAEFPALSQVMKPPAPPMAPAPSQPPAPLMYQAPAPPMLQPVSQAPAVPAAAPPLGGAFSFPPIGDDDKTVSSFGSNRGLSVSSASFVPSLPPPNAMQQASSGFAPPGFRPPGPAPVPAPKAVPVQQKFMPSGPPPPQADESNVGIQKFAVEANPMGEIRATAKAFVPSNFTPSSAPAPATKGPSMAPETSMPPLKASFAPAPNAQVAASLPDVPIGSFDNSGAPFSSGLLNSGSPSGFLGSSLPNAFDQVPSVTPVSEESSIPAQSTGSSLTGAQGMDEPPLGLSLGFGMDPQAPAGGTSSLLSAAFTNGPPAGGASSIWGAGQAVPSLGGVQPYSFGDENRYNKDEEPFQMGGQASGTWGAPGSANPAGGQGSIW